MSRKLLLLALLAAAVGGGWYFFRTHPDIWSMVTTEGLVEALHGPLERTKDVVKTSTPTPTPEPPAYVATHSVTLYLTNGGVVTGDLVEETPEHVTLRWEYGDVRFARREITRQVSGAAAETTDHITQAPSSTTP